jgi:hypothetical protein
MGVCGNALLCVSVGNNGTWCHHHTMDAAPAPPPVMLQRAAGVITPPAAPLLQGP